MFDPRPLRRALIELHRELLDAQRVEAERFGGRMSASETLQAAVDDLRFSWIRTVSGLISELDEARRANDAERRAAAERAVRRARDLFAPPDPDTAFGARYLRALQDHPGVVLAHRDVVAALESAAPAGMRIGLGLAALGRPGYLNLGHGADLGSDRSVEALRGRAHAVLDAAYEAGVRAFDAARSYGRAEEFLGEWLESRRPKAVTVSSKWGYVYTAGWRIDADPPEVKRHDAATLRRQLEETRGNLGDWLTLYQIHSATPDSGVLEDDEVLAELASLRAGGLALGVTVSGPTQSASLDRALELGLFDAVQATWNLHERAAEDALGRAHAAGLRVYVKEALANGRLAGREPASELDEAAAREGTTPDALALAAVLARPWADIVLSGAASIDTLRSNLRAAEVPWSDRLERRLAPLAEDSSAYWDRRAQLRWN